MRDLQTVKKMVEEILTDNKWARDNDDILYLEVIKKTGVAPWMTLGEFFSHRKVFDVPGFESVRRARQKAQADNPKLRGSKTEERAEAEEAFREFARS